MKLVLASASPRRKELLGHLGVPFDIAAADVDESVHAGEGARAYVARLAVAKAAALSSPGAVVVAADTSVVVDDHILGKPGDDAVLGARMLRSLSGRTHQVMTGVAVTFGERRERCVVLTDVAFRALTDAEITWYVATGEGRDKAGGYALQGRAGLFIERVVGSSTNVIGLPLTETVALLQAVGFPLPWNGP